MIFMRGLWAFLLGLLAGSVCFVQFAIVPFWQVWPFGQGSLSIDNLNAFQTIPSTVSVYFIILTALCLGLGLIFTIGDLRRRVRLIPDPWSQPLFSTVPTVCLLIAVGITVAYLLPLNAALQSTTNMQAWDVTSAMLLKWAKIHGIRTLFAVLAFAFAARNMIIAALRSR